MASAYSPAAANPFVQVCPWRLRRGSIRWRAPGRQAADGTDAGRHSVRSKIHPGAALATVVLVAALLTLALMDRGGGALPPRPPVAAPGPPLRLHPPVPLRDASVAQYGATGQGHHRRVLPGKPARRAD
jgi:hypothetical protein